MTIELSQLCIVSVFKPPNVRWQNAPLVNENIPIIFLWDFNCIIQAGDTMSTMTVVKLQYIGLNNKMYMSSLTLKIGKLSTQHAGSYALLLLMTRELLNLILYSPYSTSPGDSKHRNFRRSDFLYHIRRQLREIRMPFNSFGLYIKQCIPHSKMNENKQRTQ